MPSRLRSETQGTHANVQVREAGSVNVGKTPEHKRRMAAGRGRGGSTQADETDETVETDDSTRHDTGLKYATRHHPPNAHREGVTHRTPACLSTSRPTLVDDLSCSRLSCSCSIAAAPLHSPSTRARVLNPPLVRHRPGACNDEYLPAGPCLASPVSAMLRSVAIPVTVPVHKHTQTARLSLTASKQASKHTLAGSLAHTLALLALSFACWACPQQLARLCTPSSVHSSFSTLALPIRAFATVSSSSSSPPPGHQDPSTGYDGSYGATYDPPPANVRSSARTTPNTAHHNLHGLLAHTRTHAALPRSLPSVLRAVAACTGWV